jgi:hypothetical protein
MTGTANTASPLPPASTPCTRLLLLLLLLRPLCCCCAPTRGLHHHHLPFLEPRQWMSPQERPGRHAQQKGEAHAGGKYTHHQVERPARTVQRVRERGASLGGGGARDALLPVACDESDGAEDGDKNLVCEL